MPTDSLSVPFVVGTPKVPDPAPLSAAAVERLMSEGLERLSAIGKPLGYGEGTLARWVTRGKCGVRLEAVWGARGKGWATSRPAVARFLAAVTAGRH